MWKHVSHLGATDKANKKYFQRRIQTPTTKNLKHNKWKLIQMREIRELKKSLEFTEDSLEEKVNELKSENEKIKTKMKETYEYQINSDFLENKLIELEKMQSQNWWGERNKQWNVGKVPENFRDII